jgi:hypothetical protein
MNKNFQEKMAEKIATAQETHEQAHEEALMSLLDNKNFVEAQRSVQAKEAELKKLNNIITQLNSITAFIASDGRKFGVNVFASPVFGIGLGSVIGMISGSRGAFIDEKSLEYAAITGVPDIEMKEALAALGSPAYYKDGITHSAVYGDFNKLSALLESIFIKLGLVEFKASDITREKYELYYSIAENKALKQEKESQDLKTLEDNSKDFIIED